jgi:DNA-binding sugar fermentation-stimulating protein
MKYENVVMGTFVRRRNRFVAEVMINGSLETVHVKNTGRMGELLFPDAKVALTCSDNPQSVESAGDFFVLCGRQYEYRHGDEYGRG